MVRENKFDKGVVQMSNLKFNTVCVTGHRPKDLFGYDWDKYSAVIEKVTATVTSLHKKYGVTKYISGGAQGVDQLFFWVVEKYREANRPNGNHGEIENWLYTPCQNQAKYWKDEGPFSKKEFGRIVKRAKKNKTYKLCADKPYNAQLMYDRNTAMVKDSDIVLGIYKGDIADIKGSEKKNGGTLHCLRHAYSKGKPIIIINPVTLKLSTLNFKKEAVKSPAA